MLFRTDRRLVFSYHSLASDGFEIRSALGGPKQTGFLNRELRGYRGCFQKIIPSSIRAIRVIRGLIPFGFRSGPEPVERLCFELSHLNIRSLFRISFFGFRNCRSTTPAPVALLPPGFVPAFLFSAHSPLLLRRSLGERESPQPTQL